MALVREEASSHFWPAQAGVAVKGGAEKAVHAVRAWTQRHVGSRTKVLVKLDFSNAFNCVSREALPGFGPLGGLVLSAADPPAVWRAGS